MRLEAVYISTNSPIYLTKVDNSNVGIFFRLLSCHQKHKDRGYRNGSRQKMSYNRGGQPDW